MRRLARRVPGSWLVVAGGAAIGAVVLAAWLPVGAIVDQHQAISAANTRLAQLNAQGRTLTTELQQLASPRFRLQWFREKYQLVQPGQRLIQVVTPSSTAYSGDPGDAPIVDPVTNSQLPTSSLAPGPRTAARGGGGGFLSRVLTTLEFWR